MHRLSSPPNPFQDFWTTKQKLAQTVQPAGSLTSQQQPWPLPLLPFPSLACSWRSGVLWRQTAKDEGSGERWWTCWSWQELWIHMMIWVYITCSDGFGKTFTVINLSEMSIMVWDVDTYRQHHFVPKVLTPRYEHIWSALFSFKGSLKCHSWHSTDLRSQ